MSADLKLSRPQTLALESIYLFLRTLRPLLLSVGNEVPSLATRAQLDSTIGLAAKNEYQLVEHFTEVRTAANRWNLDGAR
jgi:hypothetical protein